jgi:hypothetical protein
VAAPTLTRDPGAPQADEGSGPERPSERKSGRDPGGAPPESRPEGGGSRDDAPSLRGVVAVCLPTLAAAIMVGGIFTGAGARIYAAVAGLLGVALAVAVRRIPRPALGILLIIGGLFAIGIVLVIPSGVDNLTHVRALVRSAVASGSALRPPVPLRPGWLPIIGWVMGATGFLAAWIAQMLKRPAIAICLPLPLAAIAATSVPKSQQAVSGVVVLALFAITLGLLSSEEALGENEVRPPLGYEIRKVLAALPVIAGVCGVLILLLQAHFLFPKPTIDPAQQAQRPKAVPLTAVEDRVLFSVVSTVSGPWRVGSLDVYDGKDWRLPPFADSKLKPVQTSGVVDQDLKPGVKADFSIAGLSGSVLPGLPNPVGVIAVGPRLAYDARNGNIRTAEGQIQQGLKYTVVAAGLPKVDDLDAITASVPRDIKQFAQIGRPPPAVVDLIARAPKESKWREFDFLRTSVLDNVTAVGTGLPKTIDAARVQDMLAGSKEGSPFEIVAAQAMLARWIDVPSRIGYGFDGGETVGDHLEVHPRNGASFVEVYFPGYKWLPVIGTPKKAKPTTGGDKGTQKVDPNVLPSDDISIQVFAFQATAPQSVALARIRQAVLVVIPLLSLAALVYVLWPGVRKRRLRSRRLRAAQRAGPRARVVRAYADWRDLAADFGEGHTADTPFMFLDRFSADEEHRQLAWLVTRTLWGDLQHDVTDDIATAAEVLSRALRRRLRRQHAFTLRVVAVLSRRSLRDPFMVDDLEVHRVAA